MWQTKENGVPAGLGESRPRRVPRRSASQGRRVPRRRASAALAVAATALLFAASGAEAFSPAARGGGRATAAPGLRMAQKMTPTRKTRKDDSFDRDAGAEEEDDNLLDFSDAQAKIREDETKRRVEEGLAVGLTKEDEEEFNAKRDDYEDMRSKIRARAADEGFEKSVATKKAIEEATQRAMAGSTSATADQMLDLSGFAEKFGDDGTEELTEEEQREIDKIASMPLWEQAAEELSATRFPTPLVVFQTACVMALIFAVSATLILRGDAAIRDFYMGLGYIPRPDEVYDFSDLDLPDGFLEQQSMEGNIETAITSATSIADQILPKAEGDLGAAVRSATGVADQVIPGSEGSLDAVVQSATSVADQILPKSE